MLYVVLFLREGASPFSGPSLWLSAALQGVVCLLPPPPQHCWGDGLQELLSWLISNKASSQLQGPSQKPRVLSPGPSAVERSYPLVHHLELSRGLLDTHGNVL